MPTQAAPIDWSQYKNQIEAPGFVDFLKVRPCYILCFA